METLTALVKAISDWSGRKTNTGKWLGIGIIAILLAVWVHLSLRGEVWIDPGMTFAATILGIWIFLGRDTSP